MDMPPACLIRNPPIINLTQNRKVRRVLLF